MRPSFFPLFPALVTALTPVARTPVLAGLMVSNACYLVFLVLFSKIVELDWDTSIVDAALALIAVAALPAIYTRVRPSYACYALLIVLIPLSGSLISFSRLLLPSFPHAILLARSVERPWALAALLVPFAILEAVMMAAFATWNWVA